MIIVTGTSRITKKSFHHQAYSLSGNWGVSLLIEGLLSKRFASGKTVICHAPYLSLWDPTSPPFFESIPPLHRFASIWAVFKPNQTWLSFLNLPDDAPGAWSLNLQGNSATNAIISAFREMYRRHRGQTHLSRELAVNALERAFLLAAASQDLPHQGNDERIHKVVDFIHDNIKRKLNIKILAAQANLSPSRFAHLFTRTMSRAPMEFVEHARLDEAKAQLLISQDSIGDIARRVGYENQFHFSTRFRKLIGISPSEFRQKSGEF